MRAQAGRTPDPFRHEQGATVGGLPWLFPGTGRAVARTLWISTPILAGSPARCVQGASKRSVGSADLQWYAAKMTPAELRSRIARSGISGKRLAGLLGIPQPNVSGWCTGIRSVPARHVARIIELTDNPPLRTEPPWRPPADMPPSRHGRTIRAKRPRPLRQPARLPRPVRPTAAEYTNDRPASASRRESDEPAQRLDLSGLINVLLNLASTWIDGNALSSEGAVPTGRLPVTDISLYQPPAAPQPGRQMPCLAVATTMTGRLHADFVAEHNKAQQEPAPHTRAPNQLRPHTATACVTHYTYGIPLIDKQR